MICWLWKLVLGREAELEGIGGAHVREILVGGMGFRKTSVGLIISSKWGVEEREAQDLGLAKGWMACGTGYCSGT